MNLDYKPALALGVELGTPGLENSPFGWSVSYDYLRSNLDKATVSGTVNGAPGSATFSSSQLKNAGLNFDNDVHLATANFYYRSPFLNVVHPYIGVGAGAAFMSHADTQPALDLTLGMRLPMSENTYYGMRYRYIRV